MRNREIVPISHVDQAFIKSCVIYEDDDMLVFNKPSGLPSQTRKQEDRSVDRLLWTFARSNGKRPRLVHRLDQETSGIILAAKTQPASAALSKAFENRQMKKLYLALVKGDARKVTRIEAPIGSIQRSDGALISAIGGRSGVRDVKPALTRFRCVAVGNGASLLECRPETGRTHQIRIHLAHAGHPILGDGIYGEGDDAPRLMLHAFSLQGPHPIGGTFDHSAPVPDDFEAFAAKLDETGEDEA